MESLVVWLGPALVAGLGAVGGYVLATEKRRTYHRDVNESEAAERALGAALALGDALISVVSEGMETSSKEDESERDFLARVLQARWEAIVELEKDFRSALFAAEAILPDAALLPLRDLSDLRNSIYTAQRIWVVSQPPTLFDKALGSVPRTQLKALRPRLCAALRPIVSLTDRGVAVQVKRIAGWCVRPFKRWDRHPLTDGEDERSD
jgi:hypothetical protein